MIQTHASGPLSQGQWIWHFHQRPSFLYSLHPGVQQCLFSHRHTHTRHGLRKLFLTGDCVSDTILSNSDILYLIGHMILDQTIIPISQENQALRG